MDAVAAQLVRSLSGSMAELATARADAAQTGAHLKYAELTGRLETMRTVISFFQQTAQAAAPVPATGANPPAEKADDGDQQEEA
ncbi:hypothetical protein LCGC14_2828710 [marine sediment metagenome]|uniref:Uncharacterized protein n=1 Tax=marine sediment metagenome TaxID=412755 RepID=A0A0F8Z1K2_9ZZZZ